MLASIRLRVLLSMQVHSALASEQPSMPGQVLAPVVGSVVASMPSSMLESMLASMLASLLRPMLVSGPSPMLA